MVKNIDPGEVLDQDTIGIFQRCWCCLPVQSL